MSRRHRSKGKTRALIRRKVRHQENHNLSESPNRDKALGRCCRRLYGTGLATNRKKETK
jgi:hypothetical protein